MVVRLPSDQPRVGEKSHRPGPVAGWPGLCSSGFNFFISSISRGIKLSRDSTDLVDRSGPDGTDSELDQGGSKFNEWKMDHFVGYSHALGCSGARDPVSGVGGSGRLAPGVLPLSLLQASPQAECHRNCGCQRPNQGLKALQRELAAAHSSNGDPGDPDADGPGVASRGGWESGIPRGVDSAKAER